ncbi:hypothetical protein NKR23_g2194 [Pleurostoma richardsiae]|uniref:Uncharacterized protein n=1 Tax=Pleurostoma richardsiae TaxID=41990 RepID=A0AA38VVJ9_9PEZI|nr:hypothetical protein NKR23_g2194 [Pleurostoma richardsiae]
MSAEDMKMPQEPASALTPQPHIADEQPHAEQPMTMSLRGGDDDVDGGDICCGLCAICSAFACYECCKGCC